MAIGILGGWGMLALGLSYYVRERIGVNRWKVLHRFTALAWVLGIVHSPRRGHRRRPPVVHRDRRDRRRATAVAAGRAHGARTPPRLRHRIVRWSSPGRGRTAAGEPGEDRSLHRHRRDRRRARRWLLLLVPMARGTSARPPPRSHEAVTATRSGDRSLRAPARLSSGLYAPCTTERISPRGPPKIPKSSRIGARSMITTGLVPARGGDDRAGRRSGDIAFSNVAPAGRPPRQLASASGRWRTSPGQTAHAWTPEPLSSWWSTSASPTRPHLARAVGRVTGPADQPELRGDGARSSRACARASPAARAGSATATPRRAAAASASNSSGLTSSTKSRYSTPAQLTSTSTGPSAAATSSAARAHSAGSIRSAGDDVRLTAERRRRPASSAARSRATRPTRAPSAANALRASRGRCRARPP